MYTSVETSSPAFTRLPVELLTMVIDQRYSNDALTWSGDVVDTSTLKSLRLASRQYAYLPRLLEKVFCKIRLEASPEHVQFAESLDLSFIKPYVKTIKMEPSKYSWTMTEKVFEDIVLITPLQEYCNEANAKRWELVSAGEDVSNLPVLRREQFSDLGLRGFVQKHMDGKMPFSEDEIKDGFHRYMQHAQRTRQMYESKRIQRAWTAVLKQFPDANVFKIGHWDFDGRGNSNWSDLGCNVFRHDHYEAKIHDKAACWQLQAPVGEALFSAAIASLVAARANMTKLTIQHISDDCFPWADNGELDDLDLSNLQVLKFCPFLSEDRDPASEASASARCSLAITKLLSKCSTSLQKLSVFPASKGHCCMPWPPPEVPTLHALPVFRSLTNFRTSLTLRLSVFTLFLRYYSALTSLTLDGCYADDANWRLLWDTIRAHPNRMHLNFDQIACHSATELSLYHYTGDPSAADVEEDPWENITYSIESYLSGTGHWNRSLIMWFEDGDGGPTDNEDDDEVEDEDDDDDDDEDEENSDGESDEDAESGSEHGDEEQGLVCV